MTQNTYLSGKRLIAFAKKDVYENYRTAAVVCAAIIGVLLIIYGISVYAAARESGLRGALPGNGEIHYVLFSLVLFVGGFIFTSRAFHEAHNRARNHDWLMLPASTLEKLFARLLSTSIVYALGITVLYFLFSALAAGLSALILRAHFGLFMPWSKTVGLMLLNYLVVQSVFLLGASFFRKTHFIKTILSLTVLGILFAVFAALIFRLVYSDFFVGFEPTEEFIALFEGIEDFSVWERGLSRAGRAFSIVMKILYWAFLAPICWTIAYFRLRETEVKDGV